MYRTLFLLCFCFTFMFIWWLSLIWNFTPFSAHNVRFGSKILTYLQSGYHLFSILLRVYKSSFHHVVQSNIRPCGRFQFPHIYSPPATNDVLISEPSDHTMYMYLGFLAIFVAVDLLLISLSYTDIPFLKITNKLLTRPSWMQTFKKILSLSEHEPHINILQPVPHLPRSQKL